MSDAAAPPVPLAAADRRELVFGFVAPLGVDRVMVEDALRVALCAADYSLETVHVSNQLAAFADGPIPTDYLGRKRSLMDAGDRMRREFSAYIGGKPKRGDAVALAAIQAIRDIRTKSNDGKFPNPAPPAIGAGGAANSVHVVDPAEVPLQATAFLIDSLKHPDELQLLKRVYGPAFVSVGIHVPPETRRAFLLKESGTGEDEDTKRLADVLLHRDETGQNERNIPTDLGQNVSGTFNTTDFILDATKEKHEIVQQLTRLVELVFGNQFLTPSHEELGMFIARAAQARSGSMARQIGAAILRDDGSVVGVGTNEVARPITGGQYFASDDHEYVGRDLVYRPQDTSDSFRERMVEDVLRRLDEDGALSDKYSSKKSDGAALSDADAKTMREKRLSDLYFDDDGALRKALLRDNIDYVRAVHAEAAAIIDSARHGVPTMASSMFTTTFPCHECARHIVAAGIKDVIYLAPYPKSAVRQLYSDSIEIDPRLRDPKKVVFRTFVGVAPERYLEFFTPDRDRKDRRGYRGKFDLRREPPHLPYYTLRAEAIARNEPLESYPFIEFLKKRGAATTPDPNTQPPPGETAS
jgi:deoxycytidylate deaminase